MPQNAEDENSASISVSGLVLMQVNCCCTYHAAACTVPGTVRIAEVFIAPDYQAVP